MIYDHGNGVFKRYKPDPNKPAEPAKPADEYANEANWKPMPGGRKGIEIHRDGKTMRNKAPST